MSVQAGCEFLPAGAATMAREQMTEQQVAAYLHLPVDAVRKLASGGEIPARKVGGRFVYTRGDVEHWAEQQLGEMDPEDLARLQRGVVAHHGLDVGRFLVSGMIPPGGVAVPLAAKTRAAVLHRMVDLADSACVVYNADHVLSEVRAREDLCSTALVADVALPHPRHPLEYDIAEGFIVVGLTPGPIPFGAADGGMTRLFFLLCCKDERTHLHVLARLCAMLQDRPSVETFLACDKPDELRAALRQRERQLPPDPAP